MAAKALIVLAASMSVALMACTSAPATPEQLIVGGWDCKIPSLLPGGRYLVTFGKTGSLHLDFDGGSKAGEDGARMNLRMEAAGTYTVNNQTMTGHLTTAKVYSLVVNGEEMRWDELPELEGALIESMNSSLESPIEKLDAGSLILKGTEEGSSLSCIRKTS